MQSDELLYLMAIPAKTNPLRDSFFGKFGDIYLVGIGMYSYETLQSGSLLAQLCVVLIWGVTDTIFVLAKSPKVTKKNREKKNFKLKVKCTVAVP